MNRTVAFIVFGTIAALGVIGSVILLLFRPDASATFTSMLLQLLGTVTLGAGVFHTLGKQGEKLQEVQEQTTIVRKQTNGTLSKLVEDNRALQERLNEYYQQAHPDQFTNVTDFPKKALNE